MSASQEQKTLRLAILGCGFMGTAILQGLLQHTPKEQSWHYTACVRSEESIQRLRQDLTGHEESVTIGGSDSIVSAAEEADIVMLGCVPSDLPVLLTTPGLARILGQQSKLIISLLAGVSTDQLAIAIKGDSLFNADSLSNAVSLSNLVRVIPSIGAKMGDSVTLVAKSASLPDGALQTVNDLFSHIGSVVPVAEGLMSDATAIGAACNALSMLALDAITDAGVAEGFDRSTAAMLAALSLRGANNLFCAGGMTPEQMKTAMSTPRGITINSVLKLNQNQVPAGIADAVREAVRYARQM